MREQLTPERLGIPDESGAIGHDSHYAAEEGDELVGRSRPGRRLASGPEQGLAARRWPAQILGPDLGQDGQGALEGLVQ